MIPAIQTVESALNRACELSGIQWNLSRFLPLQSLHHSRQTNSELRHESQTKTNIGTLGQGCLRPLAPALGEQLPLFSQAILPRVNSKYIINDESLHDETKETYQALDLDQSLDPPGPSTPQPGPAMPWGLSLPSTGPTCCSQQTPVSAPALWATPVPQEQP